MGLFLWILISLDAPFWLVFTLSALPVAMHGIASFEFLAERRARLCQQWAFRLYLGLVLIGFALGAVHGLNRNYVFPGVLILLGVWACLRARLVERPQPFKQVRYREPSRQADGALVIKGSKAKLVWLVLLVGLMLAISISTTSTAIGWVVSTVLGALFILAIYIYRPSANYLRIDHAGFEVVVAGQRSKSNWVDIVGFHVGDSDGEKMVGILYTDAYLNARAGVRQQPGDGWIRDVFVLSPEVLCSILNEWHAKIVGKRPEKIQ